MLRHILIDVETCFNGTMQKDDNLPTNTQTEDTCIVFPQNAHFLGSPTYDGVLSYDSIVNGSQISFI